MKYYVYVFLDPRKRGEFIYSDMSFDYEPFYVGKGKDSRFQRHLNPSKWENENNLHKNRKIQKILNAGFNLLDYVIFPHKNLTDERARELEMDIIKSIGRADKRLGPLTNLTDGGEGVAGWISNRTGRKLEEFVGKEIAEKMRRSSSERIKNNPISSSLEARLKISIARGRPVKQMDKQGNVLKIWHSLNLAGKELNIGVTTIFHCLTEGDRAISAGGFRWEYVDKPNIKYTKEFLNREKRGRRFIKVEHKNGKIEYIRNIKIFASQVGVKEDTLRCTISRKKFLKGYRLYYITKEEYERSNSC